jgi:HD-GYP domain-containing protein (c-di-GMP phosphodiesterase class II)
MGYTPDEISIIRKGAFVHDIGKLFVPEEILFKVDRLTKEEFEIIKNHPLWGYHFLTTGCYPESEQFKLNDKFVSPSKNIALKEECSKLTDEMLFIALQHHERIDGKGYPYGLSGESIHPYAKLVSICDVYDAITSTRCYKPSLDVEYALKCIEEGLGTQFDEKTGKAFIPFIRNIWMKKERIA